MGRLLLLALAVLASLPASVAVAAGSAWLSEPQTGYVTISYVYQTADTFYRGQSERPTPADGKALSQNTVWLSGQYSPADSWAVDLQVGWAKSNFTTGPMIPAPKNSFSGLADVNLGVTWRVVDEGMRDHLPSVALRGGVIVAGDYETGYINSIGDGGDGYEISAIVAKFLGDRFSISAEVGYRDRNNGIPATVFGNLSGALLFGEAISLGVDYSVVNATSGLDIGDPGFSPSRFPELEEDVEVVSAQLRYSFGNLGVAVFYGNVIDGRNTAASDIAGATISYSFDTF